MKGRKLLVQKTLIPLDWNPSDPNGYNEWMKMIVKENMISSGVPLIEPNNKSDIESSSGPEFIRETFNRSLGDTFLKMNELLDQAKDILRGGLA